MQSVQAYRIAEIHDLRSDDKVDKLVDQRIMIIIVRRMISFLPVQIHNRIRVCSENVNIVIADQLMDLYVCTVLRADGNGTVQHELHVGCARRLLRSKRDLLRNIRCRNDVRRLGHVVVFDHDDLQVRADLRIVHREFLQTQDQMDDILRDHIGRRRLRAEHHRDRPFRQMALFDLHILVDRVECVHLLSLVLMQTLYLYIKNRIQVERQVLCLIEILDCLLFIVMTDFADLLQNFFVIPVLKKFFQLHGILAVSGPDQLIKIRSHLRVRRDEPAAEGDAVCLVIEFLRIERIEVMKLGIFQDIRMKLRHTVDGMAVMNIHGSHVNQIVLINNIRRLVVDFFLHPSVQLFNDRKQMRNGLLEVIDRPLLKRLGKNRMIRVGAGLRYDSDRLIHLDAAHLQLTDQLRNDHGRVRIIDLNRHIFVKSVQIHASLVRFADDQLCRIAYHEILLIDTKHLTCAVAVIRIEEQGQISRDIILVKINAVFLYHIIVHRIQIEQVQTVALAVQVARNVNVIHGGMKGETSEGHFKGNRTSLKPALSSDPRVDDFMLLVVHEFLAEQTVMIIQSHAVAIQTERCD